MEQLQAVSKLGQIINDKHYHKHYGRCCYLYENYKQFVTGDTVEKLRRLSSRESDKMFDERKQVTIDICKAIVANLCHVYTRVTRSAGINTEIDSDKQDDLTEVCISYGRWGLYGYSQQRLTDFIKIDPNGFLVVDFLSTDGSDYAKPYPTEYYSPDVVDYEYVLNKLDYLVVKNEYVDDEFNTITDFTIYTSEGAVKYNCRPDLDIATEYNPNRQYNSGDLVGFDFETYYDEIEKKDKQRCKVYEIEIPMPYNLKLTPAIQIGYLQDEVTKGDTYISFFEAAVPFLDKLVKINSEADISKAKHAFPQKLQFVKECPNKAIGCQQSANGTYLFEGRICPVCNGNGFVEAHVSGLDVIYLPLNEDTKEFNLDNLVRYVAVPIETLTYQDAYVQQTIEMCKRVIYNTEMFSKQEVADTATAKLIELENMYDTIYRYAIHYGHLLEWQLEMIAGITEIKAEISVSVSKDLRLTTKAELLNMLEIAKRAGANSAVLSAINDELVYSFHSDSEQFEVYKSNKYLLPFYDKTPEQVAITLAALPNDNYYRVAYLFGEEIIKQLVSDEPKFYEFNKELQKSKFDAKIAELQEQMKAPSFNFMADES